mgnify:CR=1 FL=1
MSIKEIQDEIVDEFSMFDDWMDRNEYIIELGKKLPLIKEEFKTEDNIIKGCQSKVWPEWFEPRSRSEPVAKHPCWLLGPLTCPLVRLPCPAPLQLQRPE